VFIRSLLCCSLAGFAVATAAHAQTSAPQAGGELDTVVVAPKPEEPGRIIMTGRVVDYTGTALTIELSSGKQTIPGKRVVEIRTTQSADELAGEELWRKREYSAALAKFQAAFAAEQRRWVRRKLQARMVDCLRESEQWQAAAEHFMLLLRDDPTTPYFGSFPLPWATLFPDAAIEAKAKTWAAERTNTAAALWGAAVLLSTPARADGIARLRELTLDGDPRIALSAEAQLWRTSTVTADLAAVEAWEKKLDKLPPELAAGPTFVVGRAWGQRKLYERAALVLLRVPILHAEQHHLAAEALWSGGQMLEEMERFVDASDLYRELRRDYPKAAFATQAGERLKELEAKLPKN
jgi:tetratricopeptide (TPR) repeat protein